jgi:hypothetical protein
LHYNPAMPIKNIITGQKVTKEKLQRAKELRREMTPAEKLLWQEVRAKKLGVRFQRQQVIQGFIVDFYCHKARWLLRWMEISTIYNRRKMPGGRRLCPSWG